MTLLATSSGIYLPSLLKKKKVTCETLITPFTECYIVSYVYRFYKNYIMSGESKLERFYRKYQPLITPEHYTCVGLGFELLRRLRSLNNKYPDIASGLYLVSCEEVDLLFVTLI